MALTNAERQKRYRERLKVQNPNKYEEIRKKHLEKVKQNQKNISEMTEEEKKMKREKWKEANERRKLKNQGKDVSGNKYKKKETIQIESLKAENDELKRKNNNMKRKLYRYKLEILNLREQLKGLQKIDENCALEQPKVSVTEQPEVSVTPLTKTNMFLEELPQINEEEKDKVKKKILLLNTLTDSLKESYENADTQEKKTLLKNIALSETAKKYKIKTNISSTLGLKGRIRICQGKRKIKQYIKDIHAFYERDDISRATAGKHECITKNKQKKQKRYLLDTITKLHGKYKSEGGKVSYATFSRFRPFYVLPPKLQDRNTCGCIKHANIAFKTIKLKQLGVTQTQHVDELMKNITCRECFDCMYSKCTDCINKVNDVVHVSSGINKETPVQWFEWRLKTHEYPKIIDGKVEKRTVKKYTKEIVKGTIAELIEAFLKDLVIFKVHYFNMRYQYKAYKTCLENLDDDEIAIVCDFSENYTCKFSEEIQANHFQPNQITLHTCMLYQKNEKPKPICTISEVNEHGPGAIWAHLDPILAEIVATKPKVKKIHMFSDGPTTQYRQKHNFYLFTKRLSDYGFESGTWNFFEASHGKGAADGVGGAVKRKLDQYVAHGQDITNAEEAFIYLQQNSNVKIYLVSAKDIQDICEMIPDDVTPLRGTMKLHQILYTLQDPQKICYRTLSCYCKEKGHRNCTCEGDIGKHELLPSKNTNEVVLALSTNNDEGRLKVLEGNKKENQQKIEVNESDDDQICQTSYEKSNQRKIKNKIASNIILKPKHKTMKNADESKEKVIITSNVLMNGKNNTVKEKAFGKTEVKAVKKRKNEGTNTTKITKKKMKRDISESSESNSEVSMTLNDSSSDFDKLDFLLYSGSDSEEAKLNLNATKSDGTDEIMVYSEWENQNIKNKPNTKQNYPESKQCILLENSGKKEVNKLTVNFNTFGYLSDDHDTDNEYLEQKNCTEGNTSMPLFQGEIQMDENKENETLCHMETIKTSTPVKNKMVTKESNLKEIQPEKQIKTDRNYTKENEELSQEITRKVVVSLEEIKVEKNNKGDYIDKETEQKEIHKDPKYKTETELKDILKDLKYKTETGNIVQEPEITSEKVMLERKGKIIKQTKLEEIQHEKQLKTDRNYTKENEELSQQKTREVMTQEIKVEKTNKGFYIDKETKQKQIHKDPKYKTETELQDIRKDLKYKTETGNIVQEPEITSEKVTLERKGKIIKQTKLEEIQHEKQLKTDRNYTKENEELSQQKTREVMTQEIKVEKTNKGDYIDKETKQKQIHKDPKYKTETGNIVQELEITSEKVMLEEKSKIIKQKDESCLQKEDKGWILGETVMTRYYSRGKWTYYCGVITQVIRKDGDSNTYKISFYKKTIEKGTHLFTKPKREDTDIVPEILIVKSIELLQISESPIRFTLMSDEDWIYF